MHSAEALSPSEDFVLVESDFLRDLAIRPRLRPNDLEQLIDDQTSDSDLEHVDRPGSVRSLSTRSSSPFTDECRHDNEDVSITNDVEHPTMPVVETILQHSTPSRSDHSDLDHSPCLPDYARTLEAPASVRWQSRPSFTYERSPDDTFPGAGVLVPNPATGSALRSNQDHGCIGQMIPLYATYDSILARDPQHCDHGTVDQHIMDLLVENALNTRLEQEFGSSAARDQNLRQQMMARLRSLPIDHPVVREATKHARWGSFLSKYQSPDAAERKHIYEKVFTNIERVALQFLLECHKAHFDTACSFADLASIVVLTSLAQVDHATFTKASTLALQSQKTCIMSIDLPSVRSFVDQIHLNWQTRGQVWRQANCLEDVVDIPESTKQQQTVPVTLSDRPSSGKGYFEPTKRVYLERTALLNILNDTLTTLSDVEKYGRTADRQSGSRTSSRLKREAPEVGSGEGRLQISPPAKKPSIPEAYPATGETLSLGLTPPLCRPSCSRSDYPLTIGNRPQELPNAATSAVSEGRPRASPSPQYWQHQLRLLEQHNKERLTSVHHESTSLRERAPTEHNHFSASSSSVRHFARFAAPSTVTDALQPTGVSNVSLQQREQMNPQQRLLVQKQQERLQERTKHKVHQQYSKHQKAQWGIRDEHVVHQPTETRRCPLHTIQASPSQLAPLPITAAQPPLEEWGSNNYALQDYHMQLMLLEAAHKKRKLLEAQDPESGQNRAPLSYGTNSDVGERQDIDARTIARPGAINIMQAQQDTLYKPNLMTTGQMQQINANMIARQRAMDMMRAQQRPGFTNTSHMNESNSDSVARQRALNMMHVQQVSVYRPASTTSSATSPVKPRRPESTRQTSSPSKQDRAVRDYQLQESSFSPDQSVRDNPDSDSDEYRDGTDSDDSVLQGTSAVQGVHGSDRQYTHQNPGGVSEGDLNTAFDEVSRHTSMSCMTRRN